MNKSDLREQILARLSTELATQTTAAQLARDEAISEESRPESKYDTHSQEAAYLAEGQARLAIEIQANLEFYRTLTLPEFSAGSPVAIGALVQIESRRRATWYFIGPRAGGLEIMLKGETVLVLTPQSPLGRQLLGKHAGESVQIAGRSGLETHRIIAVR